MNDSVDEMRLEESNAEGESTEGAVSTEEEGSIEAVGTEGEVSIEETVLQMEEMASAEETLSAKETLSTENPGPREKVVQMEETALTEETVSKDELRSTEEILGSTENPGSREEESGSTESLGSTEEAMSKEGDELVMLNEGKGLKSRDGESRGLFALKKGSGGWRLIADGRVGDVFEVENTLALPGTAGKRAAARRKVVFGRKVGGAKGAVLERSVGSPGKAAAVE